MLVVQVVMVEMDLIKHLKEVPVEEVVPEGIPEMVEMEVLLNLE